MNAPTCRVLKIRARGSGGSLVPVRDGGRFGHPVSRGAGFARRSGFSVIELLVAMVILVIIVTVFARFFQRSTQSWESGMRTVETAIAGRAAVNLIARDLERAVADEELVTAIIGDGANGFEGGNELKFITVSRHEPYLAQRVHYYRSGNTLRRSLTLADGGSVQDEPVIDHVVMAEFTTEPVNITAYQLPEMVTIHLQLSNRYDSRSQYYVDFVGAVFPVHRLRYPDTGD